ncbi:MAG: hypothetical protein HY814_15635, partial [Candidatus Riflebacteria bacterium]|nr:hypothetical protein [Candidatus Riflebacteria bacterium]
MKASVLLAVLGSVTFLACAVPVAAEEAKARPDAWRLGAVAYVKEDTATAYRQLRDF